MKQTHLKLTESSSKKLLELLDSVPDNKRDNTWHQLRSDIKKIIDIWSNIDRKKSHLSKINKQTKSILTKATD